MNSELRYLKAALLALLLAGSAPAVTGPDQRRLADGLFSRGMYELALKEYATVVDQAGLTNREALLYRMAESQRELGRVAEAESTYDRVITGFPESVYAGRAALRRAEAAIGRKDYESAAAVLRTRAEGSLDPSLRASWRYFRAHAEKECGRGKQAEPIYRRLLDEDKDSPYLPFARLELAELIQARDPQSEDIRTLLEAAAQSGPDTRAGQQATLRLAAHLYGQKDFSASALAYEKVLQQDPAQAEAIRIPSAWAHFKAGRWTETRDLVAPASGADALYLRANSLRRLGQVPEARAIYRQLLEDHPEHALAGLGRYEAATLALDARDYVETLALAAALKPTPDLAEDVLWMQAEAARGLGQAAESLRFYDQLVREHASGRKADAARFHAARLTQEASRWADASERYRALAKATADRDLAAESLFASAYCRTQLKQGAEAISDWTTLVKNHPKFRAMDEVLYGRARARADLDQAASAREDLETLLKNHPQSSFGPEAHYVLGTLLEQEEKWEGAEFHYRLAVRGREDSELARRIEFRRVAVLQRQGRNDDAAAALNVLLARPSGAQGVPPALLDWLTRWNLQQQQWAKAETSALALVEQGGPWLVIGSYQAGRAREELGRTDDARASYRKAAVDGGGREALEAAYRLGVLAAQAGDTAEARSALTRAAEQAADETQADLRARSYLALGDLAVREGQTEEAARTFLSIALLYDDPEVTPEALFKAAQALQVLNRSAERDQTLQELRSRYPDHAWTKRTLGAP